MHLLTDAVIDAVYLNANQEKMDTQQQQLKCEGTDAGIVVHPIADLLLARLLGLVRLREVMSMLPRLLH